MNVLTSLLARTNQAFAQEMSRGPLDPQERKPDAAWKIPVRRISSAYYRGWKVRRLAPAVWMLYNDSREAYYIEYGINHVGRGTTVTYKNGRTYIKSGARVRRPIRKMSLIKTLNFVDHSRVGHRVWEMIWAPYRPGRRTSQSQLRRGQGISMDAVQSVSGMRFI